MDYSIIISMDVAGFVIAIIASIYPLISFLKYKNQQKK